MPIFLPLSARVPGRRTTYANVTATLALVVALSGTSYAAATLAKNSVGTAQLKKNAVTSAKVKDGTVKPGDLSRSARDLAASGPVTPGFLTGTISDLPPSGPSTTQYRRAAVSGPSSAAISTGGVASLSPSYEVVAEDLTVQLLQDLPPGGSVSVELVATDPPFLGENAVLGCVVTGTAGDDLSCRSTGQVTIPADQYLFLVVKVGNGADPIAAAFNLEMTPTS